MECRCYRGDVNRTKLVKLEYKPLDVVYMLVFVLMLSAIIVGGILPYSFTSASVFYDIVFFKI